MAKQRKAKDRSAAVFPKRHKGSHMTPEQKDKKQMVELRRSLYALCHPEYREKHNLR